jgi:hypothetical protein
MPVGRAGRQARPWYRGATRIPEVRRVLGGLHSRAMRCVWSRSARRLLVQIANGVPELHRKTHGPVHQHVSRGGPRPGENGMTNVKVDTTALLNAVDGAATRVRTKVLDFSFNELLDMYASDELIIEPRSPTSTTWTSRVTRGARACTTRRRCAASRTRRRTCTTGAPRRSTTSSRRCSRRASPPATRPRCSRATTSRRSSSISGACEGARSASEGGPTVKHLLLAWMDPMTHRVRRGGRPRASRAVWSGTWPP